MTKQQILAAIKLAESTLPELAQFIAKARNELVDQGFSHYEAIQIISHFNFYK